MKSGHAMIAAERGEQLSKHGYDDAHDDHYHNDELVKAARCYMSAVPAMRDFSDKWPWPAAYWRPRTRIQNLTKAGALIAAEIDRAIREKQAGVDLCDIERRADTFGQDNPIPWWKFLGRYWYAKMAADIRVQSKAIKQRRAQAIQCYGGDVTAWPEAEVDAIITLKHQMQRDMQDAAWFVRAHR